MSETPKIDELAAELRKAHDVAGRIPQGTMAHEAQWLPFAGLYNAADALLNALETTATPAPQSALDDDREAMRKLAEGGKAASEKIYEIGTGVGGLGVNFPDLYEAYGQWDDYSAHAHTDTVLMLLDELDAISRTTVPDAATGWHDKSSAETAAVMNHELATTLRVQRDAALEMMNEHRCGEKNESLMEALVGARAEHDAALAAVDAIRTLHERGTVQIIAFDHSRTPRETCLHCSQVQEGEQVSPGDAYIWPCPTVAALDGAPEPEREREYRRVRPDGVPVFNAVFETMPLLDDYYTAEYRTVSPWLPVEGES